MGATTKAAPIRARDIDTDAVAVAYARAYLGADAEALRRGLAWYGDARAMVAELAAESGRSVDAVAAVVAVLSPRVAWSENVAAARWILGDSDAPYRGQVLGANLDKALRIVHGEAPETVVSGPKVSAFYRALRGDDTAVVIDTWMVVAADVELGSLTRRKYDILADALRVAAADADVPAAAFQAVVWCAIRGAAD